MFLIKKKKKLDTPVNPNAADCIKLAVGYEAVYVYIHGFRFSDDKMCVKRQRLE